MSQIPFIKYVYLALAVNFITLIAVFLLQSHLPPQVPLFYGLPQSEDQLVPPFGLTIPAFVSILIILANTSASLLIKDTFLKKTLVLSGILITAFSFIATIKIILLVGNF